MLGCGKADIEKNSTTNTPTFEERFREWLFSEEDKKELIADETVPDLLYKSIYQLKTSIVAGEENCEINQLERFKGLPKNTVIGNQVYTLRNPSKIKFYEVTFGEDSGKTMGVYTSVNRDGIEMLPSADVRELSKDAPKNQYWSYTLQIPRDHIQGDEIWFRISYSDRGIETFTDVSTVNMSYGNSIESSGIPEIQVLNAEAVNGNIQVQGFVEKENGTEEEFQITLKSAGSAVPKPFK